MRVYADGRDIDIEIHVDMDGFIYIKAYKDLSPHFPLPKMSPEEARELARRLLSAADKMEKT